MSTSHGFSRFDFVPPLSWSCHSSQVLPASLPPLTPRHSDHSGGEQCDRHPYPKAAAFKPTTEAARTVFFTQPSALQATGWLRDRLGCPGNLLCMCEVLLFGDTWELHVSCQPHLSPEGRSAPHGLPDCIAGMGVGGTESQWGQPLLLRRDLLEALLGFPRRRHHFSKVSPWHML